MFGLNIHIECSNMIYQHSVMALRFSGQTTMFGGVYLYPSLFWELKDKGNLKKIVILTRKSRIHGRIYRTWPIE